MVGILEGGKQKEKKRAKQRPLSRRSTTTSIYSNRAWRSISLALLEAQAPPLPGRRFAVYEGPMRPPVSSAPPTFLSPFSHFGYPSLPASFSQFLGWVSSRSCKHASFCIFFSFLDRVLVLPPRYVTCPFFLLLLFPFRLLSAFARPHAHLLVGGSVKGSSGQSSWCSLGLKKGGRLLRP